jgi:hypothetical protein
MFRRNFVRKQIDWTGRARSFFRKQSNWAWFQPNSEHGFKISRALRAQQDDRNPLSINPGSATAEYIQYAPKKGDISVPFRLNGNACRFHSIKKTGMEREAEQAINGGTDYANRSYSSNYTLVESKKAERSTISVDLLVLEAIGID